MKIGRSCEPIGPCLLRLFPGSVVLLVCWTVLLPGSGHAQSLKETWDGGKTWQPEGSGRPAREGRATKPSRSRQPTAEEVKRDRDYEAASERLTAAWNDRRWPEVERAARQQLALRNGPNLYASLGWSIYMQGRLSEAEEAFRQSLKLDRRNRNAIQGLTNVCIRRGNDLLAAGDFTAAESAFRAALRADSSNAEIEGYLRHGFAGDIISQGNRSFAAGNFSAAEAAYRAALQRDSKNALAQTNLGLVFAQEGRPRDAEAAFRTAIKLNPQHAKAYSGLGIHFCNLKQPAEAEPFLRRALELDPADAIATNGLAVALWDLGRLPESERFFRKAVELQPESAAFKGLFAGMLVDRALQLSRQPGWSRTEMEALSREAIALDPRNASAHNNLAATLWDRGRLAEAESAYRRALEIDPGYAKAKANLTALLHERGATQDPVAQTTAGVAAASIGATAQTVTPVPAGPESDNRAFAQLLSVEKHSMAATVGDQVNRHEASRGFDTAGAYASGTPVVDASRIAAATPRAIPAAVQNRPDYQGLVARRNALIRKEAELNTRLAEIQRRRVENPAGSDKYATMMDRALVMSELSPIASEIRTIDLKVDEMIDLSLKGFGEAEPPPPRSSTAPPEIREKP